MQLCSSLLLTATQLPSLYHLNKSTAPNSNTEWHLVLACTSWPGVGWRQTGQRAVPDLKGPSCQGRAIAPLLSRIALRIRRLGSLHPAAASSPRGREFVARLTRRAYQDATSCSPVFGKSDIGE